MGGRGSGGHRQGAGRKKKPTHLRGIDGGAGRRGPMDPPDGTAPPPPPVADVALLEPPAGLGVIEAGIWRAWAPIAHIAGTLTTSTAANFAHLCQLEADRQELRARYTWRRDATGDVVPLLVMDKKEELAIRREHRTLSKDIHARQKDFMIAPFGKELAPPGDPGAGEIDPLDRFTRKQG